MVKARVVKFAAQRGARGPAVHRVSIRAVGAHLRYLQRDGVTRDGERGEIYCGFEDGSDRDEGRAFAREGA